MDLELCCCSRRKGALGVHWESMQSRFELFHDGRSDGVQWCAKLHQTDVILLSLESIQLIQNHDLVVMVGSEFLATHIVQQTKVVQ